MRRIVWALLLLYTFTIPWEYSLDLGAPLGNVARITGLLVLLAAIPAVLQSGRLRSLGAVQWLVLALYLWFCASLVWTINRVVTFDKVRGSFQELMIVWLVWEFAETPEDLRSLLRAFVAGSWVLAILTVVNFSSPEAIALGQYRFAAYGQDPNDVARFLDLGFPLAALLGNSQAAAWPKSRVDSWVDSRWLERVLAIGYLPLGLVAVLLTASRGGFLAALVALIGCALLLGRGHARAVLTGALALPAIAAGLWLVIPSETFARLATIPEQLRRGDLNQRLNIWSAGLHAFMRAPILGTGAGTFVNAAGLSPIDTAHNTALSIAVSTGLLGLTIVTAIIALVAFAALHTEASLRRALLITLLVWAVTSSVSTVEDSRTTWLLFAVIAVAGRMAVEDHTELAECFPDPRSAWHIPISRARAAALSANSAQF
jgi:O-antigen ligase